MFNLDYQHHTEISQESIIEDLEQKKIEHPNDTWTNLFFILRGIQLIQKEFGKINSNNKDCVNSLQELNFKTKKLIGEPSAVP